jgi:hypothetical protein
MTICDELEGLGFDKLDCMVESDRHLGNAMRSLRLLDE